MQVTEVEGKDVIRIELPTLTDKDKEVISTWGSESTGATSESTVKVALEHGKASGLTQTQTHDRVVVYQKIGDASVVKIIELDQ
ncbi:pyruvate kinase [Salvia divinorum]|uniref:Pyruvate kinase n=1 Tax=Salvia divinorum TaxID=28513 RepID=A0ABD1HCE2_SALDI